jgi:outer membrane protein
MIQMEQLVINKDNTELSIAANIRNSVLDMVNQVSNIQLSKVAEETALEALNLTQESYASGAVAIVQLLDAQRNYLNSQLISAGANYNYLLSSLTVERALGYYFLFNPIEKNEEFQKRFFEFLQNKN